MNPAADKPPERAPDGDDAVLGPATAVDAEALAALHARCFVDAWPAPVLASMLQAPGALALQLHAAERLLGFILCRACLDEAEVLTIGVAAEGRGRGFGGRLLDSALQVARAGGVRTVFLEVAESNRPARALYQRRGFIPVGRRRGYYRETSSDPVDALIMACELGL